MWRFDGRDPEARGRCEGGLVGEEYVLGVEDGQGFEVDLAAGGEDGGMEKRRLGFVVV